MLSDSQGTRFEILSLICFDPSQWKKRRPVKRTAAKSFSICTVKCLERVSRHLCHLQEAVPPLGLPFDLRLLPFEVRHRQH